VTDSVNTREIVLDLLLEINKSGSFSHISIGNTLKKYQYLEKTERSFITKVTEGTIENMIRIDYIINQFSTVKVNKIKPLIRNLLRMTVYQFLFMDSIPNSAACNESVKLATKRGFSQLKGFVNGVLRNIERNLLDIKYPDPSDDLILYLSVYYSIPEWIVEQWIVQYGAEEASRMIKSFSERENLITLRIDNNKISTKDAIESLINEGVTVKENPYFDNCIHIKGFDYLAKMELFKKGYACVQDVSSMMVSYVAAPKEGDYIIDICAAPGGKSLHLSELLNSTGMVEARDLTERKVSLIEENIARTGATNIFAREVDALILDNESIEKADIVIADLPCSGLGVIGKKSDIKYNMTKEKQEKLVLIQRAILKNAVSYVKSGGSLIYSTCTTNKVENEENYKYLLDNFSVEVVDITENVPKELVTKDCKNGFIQLLSGIDEKDGFFISKVKKL
jgi:16S rRNA (cytosine967-C5)-methyltransferase